MTVKKADVVMELASAVGHYAEREDKQVGVSFGGSWTPSCISTVSILGNPFNSYDAAMAYLQALGVRDDT